jgi:hypothetical protein
LADIVAAIDNLFEKGIHIACSTPFQMGSKREGDRWEGAKAPSFFCVTMHSWRLDPHPMKKKGYGA